MMRDKIPAERLAAILAYNKARKAAQEGKDKLDALIAKYGVTDADALGTALDALKAKAEDMSGIAALVGNISNTAYRLLPSGLRTILDKYR